MGMDGPRGYREDGLQVSNTLGCKISRILRSNEEADVVRHWFVNSHGYCMSFNYLLESDLLEALTCICVPPQLLYRAGKL